MRRKDWIATGVVAGRTVVRPYSPADVLVSGGSAFVILNRTGEMPGGVLSPERANAILAEIASAFRSMKDETGARLFETVAFPGESAGLGLDHPASGDLILIAGAGTSLSGGFPRQGDAAPVLLPAEVTAQHGYGPDPELDGVFFHAGPGIEPARIPVVKATEVAARVTSRLDLSPPGAK
jgi:predicted AlkP superfamily phosphohydrolase/phosphomutase